MTADRPLHGGSAVSVANLTHSFGAVSVLDGIDLTVDRGEFVGLVGPNGAGKTTLLRAINGVLDPDEGQVTLDGQPIEELSSKEVSRQVATVPQDSHVGFSFTAEQIVEMGRTPHQSRLEWTPDTEPIERALEWTETAAFRDRKINDLSGGERQRVLLARALAQEPSVLVLDEPTASLDINHQIQVLGIVEELVAEGKTAIAAIHDLDLAARFCDRLCLLSDGAIRASGRPEAVLADDELATAFGTATAVTQNPATGTPTVAAFADRESVDGRIHVAGGGVSGQRVVRRLWRAGFDVSIGPLPVGDRAAELAADLGCPTVTAPPFEPVADRHRERAATLAREADLLVVTAGPGSGVLADLSGDSIHAAFGEEHAAQSMPALGDGGHTSPAADRTVETEQALLAAVRDALGVDE